MKYKTFIFQHNLFAYQYTLMMNINLIEQSNTMKMLHQYLKMCYYTDLLIYSLHRRGNYGRETYYREKENKERKEKQLVSDYLHQRCSACCSWQGTPPNNNNKKNGTVDAVGSLGLRRATASI